MSRTEALELNVSKNGTRIKTFTVGIDCGDEDVTTLLDVLHKTKENSNNFLTTLVEADKTNLIESGGAVTSHSKRKVDEEGAHFCFFTFVSEIYRNSFFLII